MRSTIIEALKNVRELTILKVGHGHWKIECLYRNRRIKTTTTNSQAIDDYNSDHYETRDGKNRRKMGYDALISEAVRANKKK